MISKQQFELMARYNAWMNEKFYDAASRLSDEHRKADRGAFFKSLHDTLDHILTADRIWMNRFCGQRYETVPIGTRFVEDFATLRLLRRDMDRDILAWLSDIDEATLNAPFTWTSGMDGTTRTQSLWILVTHLFNHQTHHRGQVSTLLKQLGVDPGQTDLPVMPALES